MNFILFLGDMVVATKTILDLEEWDLVLAKLHRYDILIKKTLLFLFLNRVIQEIISKIFAYSILLGTMLTSSKNVVSLSRPSRQK